MSFLFNDMVDEEERSEKMCDWQSEIDRIDENRRRIFDAIRSGVGYYLEIKRFFEAHKTDSTEFRESFLNFYQINRAINLNRNRAYRNPDLENLFKMLADGEELPIGEVIRQLSPGNGAVHLSFASKVLHTINNDLPIYDSKVREFFHLPTVSGGNWETRLDRAVENYERLREIYRNRSRNRLDSLERVFEEGFSVEISDVKKIDFMIWGYGRL